LQRKREFLRSLSLSNLILHLKQKTICVYHFIFAKEDAKNRKYTARRAREEAEEKGKKEEKE